MSDSAFEGYHQFPHGGSFEVFYHDKDDNDLAMNDHGWYWWACQPGCMPDGDPSGPFPTSEGAYLAAIGE